MLFYENLAKYRELKYMGVVNKLSEID